MSLQRDAALRFLLDRIDYERMRTMPYGLAEFRLGRMRQLLARLGHPEQGLPVVHIAGTKGKGSTAAMIAAILRAAGYRTGLFTSPHLERVEERIAVNGEPCRPEEFGDLIAAVRPAVEALDRQAARRGGGRIGPTYFEVLTAMALLLLRPLQGRSGRAGGGPGRAARFHQRLHTRCSRSSPASVSIIPGNWETRWRPSPGRRPALSSGECRC